MTGKPHFIKMYREKHYPVGRWLRFSVPESKPVIAFTYYDHEAGFSAKGGLEERTDLAEGGDNTLRLTYDWLDWTALTDEEIARRGLPEVPEWIKFYGEQPPQGILWGYWRDHPLLQGLSGPEYPDDLQLFIHDGGHRFTQLPPEYIWVRVTGFKSHGFADVFTANVLNVPHLLQSIKQFDVIQFLVPPDFPFPIMVTQKYLDERESWMFTFCPNCNLSEVFDAPSDFRKRVFPNSPVGENYEVQSYTMFCPACGGVRVAAPRKTAEDPYVFTVGEKGESRQPFAGRYVKPEAEEKRKWWQFRR